MSNDWDYPTSRMFIVLLSNLDSWKDLEPSIHQLWLYFVCDVSNYGIPKTDMPQVVHMYYHPGYDIFRLHEILQAKGDYVLRIQRMVKRSFSGCCCEIPFAGYTRHPVEL